MFCPKCGKQLQNDLNFCTRCGTKIETVDTKSKKKVSKKIVRLLIAACALSVCIIVLCILLYRNSEYRKLGLIKSVTTWEARDREAFKNNDYLTDTALLDNTKLYFADKDTISYYDTDALENEYYTHFNKLHSPSDNDGNIYEYEGDLIVSATGNPSLILESILGRIPYDPRIGYDIYYNYYCEDAQVNFKYYKDGTIKDIVIKSSPSEIDYDKLLSNSLDIYKILRCHLEFDEKGRLTKNVYYRIQSNLYDECTYAITYEYY